MEIGKSMYVWNFWEIGSAQQIAERANSIGLDSIMLKIADGVLTFGKLLSDKSPEAEASREKELLAVVTACKALGIEVIGWQYAYGYDPIAEAEKAVYLANKLGVSGFIVDAEAEYKRHVNRADRAKIYMSRISDGIHVPVGLSTYRFPNYHREFPWKEFLEKSHFVVPQVYWLKANNPGQQLFECIKQYTALYATYKIPELAMYPAGCAYEYEGWRPTVAQLLEFDDAVKLNGLRGISFWWWKTAISLGLESTIAGLRWGNDYEGLLDRIEVLESDVQILKKSFDGVGTTLDSFVKRVSGWIDKY